MRREFRPEDPDRHELDPAAIALGDTARDEGAPLPHTPDGTADTSDGAGSPAAPDGGSADDELASLLHDMEGRPETETGGAEGRAGGDPAEADLESLLHGRHPDQPTAEAPGAGSPAAPDGGSADDELASLLRDMEGRPETEPGTPAQAPAEAPASIPAPADDGEDDAAAAVHEEPAPSGMPETADDPLEDLTRQFDPGTVPDEAGERGQALAGGSPFEHRYPEAQDDAGDTQDNDTSELDILMAGAAPPPGHRAEPVSEAAGAPGDIVDEPPAELPAETAAPEAIPSEGSAAGDGVHKDDAPPPAAEPSAAAAPHTRQERRGMKLPWRRRSASPDDAAQPAASQPPPPQQEKEGRRRRPTRTLFLVFFLLLMPSLTVIWLFLEDPRGNDILRAYIPKPYLETLAVTLGHRPIPVEMTTAAAITPPKNGPGLPGAEQPGAGGESPAATPEGSAAPLLPATGGPALPDRDGAGQDPLPAVAHVPFDAAGPSAGGIAPLGRAPAGPPDSRQPADTLLPAVTADTGFPPAGSGNPGTGPATAAPPTAPTAALEDVKDTVQQLRRTVARLETGLGDLSEDMRIVLSALPPAETVEAAKLQDLEFRLTALQNGIDLIASQTAPPPSMPAETGTADTAPPAKPDGLTALPGPDRVTLTWEPPQGPVTLWFYAMRSGSRWSEWMTVPGSNGLTNSHTFTGLLAGRKYSFKVRAANGGTEGPESDEVTTITGATTASASFPSAPATEMQALVVRPAPVGEPLKAYPGRVYQAPRARYSITSRLPKDLGPVKVGDWLPGYGRVLRILDGPNGRTAVTENGSLFDPEPIVSRPPPAAQPRAPAEVITNPAPAPR